ncbi:PEBP-like protein [Corynespora cassiicola Philippines]|uniref:PEBP-like protein n=1 Tax=Corynespora cassiicola Philippines TaxID=1448308 RepID=A0A2T2NY08_CORCC|nr:PEBP-like protein [Corynespora cassiicola Philippines]
MSGQSTVQSILAQCQETGKSPLKLHFPDDTITDPDTSPTRDAVRNAPTFSIASSISKSPSAKYVVIALDLDAPIPTLPVASPILHGLMVDLVPESGADADGWIKLTPATNPAAPWLPPNPPPISSPHRYVLMIWEQPEGLSNDIARSKLELSDKLTLWNRIRWDQDACEHKLGLGKVLGGNFFLVG